MVRVTRWKARGRGFDSRRRHTLSFWNFRLRNVVHIPAKTIQMKSSMTFIQSNGWTEIDLILKQKWRRFIWWQVSFKGHWRKVWKNCVWGHYVRIDLTFDLDLLTWITIGIMHSPRTILPEAKCLLVICWTRFGLIKMDCRLVNLLFYVICWTRFGLIKMDCRLVNLLFYYKADYFSVICDGTYM